ncbi:hypothetical protein PSYCG_09195 [Psychrobacter sp. G]|nr:hypothetical protein PSYCG_09195 [Psychrobacter sp. G]
MGPEDGGGIANKIVESMEHNGYALSSLLSFEYC